MTVNQWKKNTQVLYKGYIHKMYICDNFLPNTKYPIL